MPERLSEMWCIGIKTSYCALKDTTYQRIRTKGVLVNIFKIDKVQLCYKQLCRRHILFYADYLKAGKKYVRGFIGGTLYTNNTGFKKFFP